MTISGNRNSMTFAQERARAGGHEPLIASAALVGDDKEWPAGLILCRNSAGAWRPYDVAEAVVVGAGDGTETEFAFDLGPDVIPGSVSIDDGVEEFTDLGTGALLGDGDTTPGTGTIDYATGIGSITFKAAPADEAEIAVSVKHRPRAVLDEKTDTASAGTALVVRHGTVKLSMLVTDAGTAEADPTAATAAIVRQLEAAGIWPV